MMTREVIDPLALGLLHDIVAELEAALPRRVAGRSTKVHMDPLKNRSNKQSA
ncbi:hypothetical protein H8A99_29955 [Bradyrhizobium sp. Arg68]|uniref:hypothetical protein n=1 Tax=Bradyrhizobium ivorense TaxID=2511166 RepID=UPI001E4AD806|nr:hypothetical protein [Bradyrhizobium ivorense]MCC8940561.1 hypothetical protein [Bradyrhizobium ivorense]